MYHFLLSMSLNQVPFVNIDLESIFEDAKTGNDVLAVLNELVGE